MVRKPFALLGLLPAALQGVVLDFEWSRDRLWQLDLPVHQVPVSELRWMLSLPLWRFEGVPFVLSPEQVRADPDRYHVQFARTMATDLGFPLHVLVSHDRVLTVLDGFHRLFKAELLGLRTVAAKKVTEACLDLIAWPGEDQAPATGPASLPGQL